MSRMEEMGVGDTSVVPGFRKAQAGVSFEPRSSKTTWAT